MSRRPPRSTLTDTLFPSTTLFRSAVCLVDFRREILAPFGVDLQHLATVPAQFAIFDQLSGGVLGQRIAHAVGQRYPVRDRVDDRRRRGAIADPERRQPQDRKSVV